MQEHIYYVLEDNRTLCKDIRCRVSDTPPPEESSSTAHDQPPAYQDITELSSKNNDEIDKDNGNNQGDIIFSNPNSPHSPSMQ